MNKQIISIIVPCYNEESTLPVLYRELERITGEMSSFAFEYLFVNDGSSDRTFSMLQEMAEKDEKVKYISFSRNFGKEAALFAGLSNAKGDYVATMDADMQDPPSLLPEMVTFLETGEYDNEKETKSAS